MSADGTVRIGFTPLSDCAPIVAAVEKGFLARHGVDFELHREPSWANIRDKLAAGALDAAHMLAPMPLAATLGVGPFQEPLVTALSLNLGGNAITLSSRLWSELALAPDDAGDPVRCGAALARLVAQRGRGGAPALRLGTVFPVSMHHYELRWWLAASGIVPDRDVRILVVPPPRMVDALEAGALDGFCVGAPWNSVAVARGSGVVATTTHALWNHAPEKVLGVRARWADAHRELHRAMLRALLEAALWCDTIEGRSELVSLLAHPAWVGAAEAALAPALLGGLWTGREDPRQPAVLCFDRFAANFPWRSHAVWIACQMVRWGQIEKAVDLWALAGEVYRPDLHREAARELGLARPALDEKVEGVHAAPWQAPGEPDPVLLGPDLLFDGARFDARDPVGYLAGCAVHERRVELAELEAAQRARA